jgi:hypothetical protein
MFIYFNLFYVQVRKAMCSYGSPFGKLPPVPPKVRVRVKASYIGISTYDYTLVATDTYRSERRSNPDLDSAYSGSGFSESGSDILPFKYEFIKNRGFLLKNFGSGSDHQALDADPEPRIR